MKKNRKNHAYVATAEVCTLFCAYGTTPGKALKELGKLIDKSIADDEWTMVTGMNVTYDEEGTFCVNATISTIAMGF